MNNVKYSQTKSNFALAICTNEIKKTKNQNTIRREFKRFKTPNPKIPPQCISYNKAPKGNLSIKVLIPT